MMWLVGFIFLVYLLTLSILLFSLVNLKTVRPNKSNQVYTSFTILVAFRNEERNLPNLVSSLLALNYPTSSFEVIFINDHSNDASVTQLKALINEHANFKMLELPKDSFGKKAALTLGVQHAQYEFIITTDADCVVNEKWLQSYHAYLTNHTVDAVIGSVAIATQNSYLAKFQYYDFMALQAVSLAMANLNKPILCNGANFCYSKATFLKVDGFSGNENQPSGDDVLLLEKMVNTQHKIGQLLDADNLVLTQAVNKLKPFVQQRKRWFNKTKYTSSILQKILGVLLLIVNISLLSIFILSILFPSLLTSFLMLFLIKISIDFFLIFEFAKKLKLPFCTTDFLLISLFYPIGLVYFLAYLTNSKMTWKQRNYLL